MGKFIDLTGKVFDRWTVLGKGELDSCNKILWVCRCECGTVREVAGKSLRERRSRSCGCYDYKNSQEKHFTNTETAEYRTWKAMRSRCNNPKTSHYKYYGGRGIKVCERWDKFPNFYADMGKKPTDSHTIDRIDVNGDYEPKNCRWATWEQQNLNKRNTKPQ